MTSQPKGDRLKKGSIKKKKTEDESHCALSVETDLFLMTRGMLLLYSLMFTFRLASSVLPYEAPSDRLGLWETLYDELIGSGPGNAPRLTNTAPSMATAIYLGIGSVWQLAGSTTAELASYLTGVDMVDSQVSSSGMWAITKLLKATIKTVNQFSIPITRMAIKLTIGIIVFQVETFTARGFFYRFGRVAARWFFLFTLLGYDTLFYSGSDANKTLAYVGYLIITGCWLRNQLSLASFSLGMLSCLYPTIGFTAVAIIIPRIASQDHSFASASLSAAWYGVIGLVSMLSLDLVVNGHWSREIPTHPSGPFGILQYLTIILNAPTLKDSWMNIFMQDSMEVDPAGAYGSSSHVVAMTFANLPSTIGVVIFMMGVTIYGVKAYIHALKSRRGDLNDKIFEAFKDLGGPLYLHWTKQTIPPGRTSDDIRKDFRGMMTTISDITWVYYVMTSLLCSFAGSCIGIQGALPHFLCSMNFAAVTAVHYLLDGHRKTAMAKRNLEDAEQQKPMKSSFVRKGARLMMRGIATCLFAVTLGRVVSVLGRYHYSNSLSALLESMVFTSFEGINLNDALLPPTSIVCLTDAAALYYPGRWSSGISSRVVHIAHPRNEIDERNQYFQKLTGDILEGLETIPMTDRFNHCDFLFDRTAQPHSKADMNPQLTRANRIPAIEIGQEPKEVDPHYVRWMGCGLSPVIHNPSAIFLAPSSETEYHGNCLWLMQLGLATYDLLPTK